MTAGEVWAIESVIAGDAYLVTNVGIDLASDPDFFSDVDQAISNFSPTGIVTNMAASIATLIR